MEEQKKEQDKNVNAKDIQNKVDNSLHSALDATNILNYILFFFNYFHLI